MGEFASYREWREKLLVDADEVFKAFQKWDGFAHQVMQQAEESLTASGTARVEIPRGFKELTYLLASVCDIGPYTIDPSPLTDYLRIAQHCELDGVAEVYDHTIDDFGIGRDRVVPIANRLITAMIADAGLEERGVTFEATKLANPNEARDQWMYDERARGQTLGQILFDLESHVEWKPIGTVQGVGRAIDGYCRRKRIPLIRRTQE